LWPLALNTSWTQYYIIIFLLQHVSDICGMLESRCCQSLAYQFQDMLVSESINSDVHKNGCMLRRMRQRDTKVTNLCYVPSSIRVLRLWSSTLRAESSESALASNLDASCRLFWWNRTMACSKWSLMNRAASLPARCLLTYHFETGLQWIFQFLKVTLSDVKIIITCKMNGTGKN